MELSVFPTILGASEGGGANTRDRTEYSPAGGRPRGSAIKKRVSDVGLHFKKTTIDRLEKSGKNIQSHGKQGPTAKIALPSKTII